MDQAAHRTKSHGRGAAMGKLGDHTSPSLPACGRGAWPGLLGRAKGKAASPRASWSQICAKDPVQGRRLGAWPH